jgi:uncharacterized protein with HEPN domain
MRGNIDRQIIEKIYIYCNDITEILAKHNKNYDEFLVNREFYLAVSMAEMQIGEDSKFLSEELKDSSKDIIPWRGIRDMRNMYAHEYKKMKISDIWDTAVNDIPILQAFCEKILKPHSTEKSN